MWLQATGTGVDVQGQSHAAGMRWPLAAGLWLCSGILPTPRGWLSGAARTSVGGSGMWLPADAGEMVVILLLLGGNSELPMLDPKTFGADSRAGLPGL